MSGKREAQAVGATALIHEGSEEERAILIMTIIGGVGATDEVVSLLSVRTAGEDQDPEYGGRGEGDGIKGTWRPRVVRLVFSVHLL